MRDIDDAEAGLRRGFLIGLLIVLPFWAFVVWLIAVAAHL